MLYYHRNQIQILEYKQLVEVHTHKIQIQCQNEQLLIQGKDLAVGLLNESEIIIKGEIYVIQWV